MQDRIRAIAIYLFWDVFNLSGLKPNAVTIVNFIMNGLPAVACFATGHNLWALYFCIAYNLLDYIDGELARRKFGVTEYGSWLDTSLDWLLYLLIIGGITYATQAHLIGIVCLISIVYSNYISVTTWQNKRFHRFPFSPIVYLVGGAIANLLVCSLMVIAVMNIVKISLLWISYFKASGSD